MSKGEAWTAWQQANREAYNARQRAYWKARRGYVPPTPEESAAKRRAKVQRWRDEHPEEVAAGQAAHNANKRAKALGLPDRLTMQHVQALWASQPVCVDCGQGRGVDHVVRFADGGANVASNLANRCQVCNARKENAGRVLPPDHPNYERARKVREHRHRATTGPAAL